jgi:hypothetical protein
VDRGQGQMVEAMDLDTTIVLHEDKQYYPEVSIGVLFGRG